MFKPSMVHAAVLAAIGGGLLSSGQTVLAQDSVQRIEITGSNIKRTDTETASPVQVLRREDIERTGKQSIQEILRTVTADGQGSIPSSFTAGFASGSAAVSLRGLGVNSTLVLVNGRRMTTYGLADDGTRNFVDLNSLPLEAVDRIEVLKDGASAIYGADAVGGVVNVILRKNYKGGSIGGSFGVSGKSDGQTTRAFGAFGVGDVDTDKYNVFVSIEASKQKNIWSKDRGYLGASDLRPYGFYNTTNGERRPYIGAGPTSNSPYGVTRDVDLTLPRVNVRTCGGNVSTVTGLCLYNSLDEQEIQPEIDRLNVFARGTLQFSATLSAYLEVGYFNSKSKANGTLGANNDAGVYKPGDPLNPLITHDFMILPAGNPYNTFGVDRAYFVRPPELGGRDQKTDNQVVRIVQGLQGTAWGWDFDVGASFIKSRLVNDNTGYIVYDAMQAAINNGTYNIVNPYATSAAVLASISPKLTNVPTSSIKAIDFKLSRDLMELGGGSLGLAIGGETRWEAANTPPVPFTDTGAIVGLGYSAFTATRHLSALFAELSAPVTKWLELTAAARWDHYSDFGNSTTPKLGFKIKPMKEFAVRGTYAEAFRAPGPAERGGSSFGFTSVGILSQGNPTIEPEKAKSYTLGLVAEPFSGSSITVDYWRVDRQKEIVQADPASIIPASLDCQLTCDGTVDPDTGRPKPDYRTAKLNGAQPNTFLYYDTEGNLVTVTGFYRNANKTRTDGLDIELRQAFNLGGYGKLTGQLNWTHVNKFRRTDADGKTFEYAGTQGPIVLSAGAGTPKDRATLSLSWDKGPYAASVAVNYVGPLKLIDHKGEQSIDEEDGTVLDNTNGLLYNWDGTSTLGCSAYDLSGKPWRGNCKVPAFTTFDLFGKWSPMKNLDINISIQNLFDKKAPLDPYLVNTYGINYNQTWHQAGAVGRFFTIGAKYTF